MCCDYVMIGMKINWWMLRDIWGKSVYWEGCFGEGSLLFLKVGVRCSLLKVDLRSAVTRLSLSRKVRILKYSDRFYPSEILASSDPLSTLKRGSVEGFQMAWMLIRRLRIGWSCPFRPTLNFETEEWLLISGRLGYWFDLRGLVDLAVGPYCSEILAPSDLLSTLK